jgi:hypothetical protein
MRRWAENGGVAILLGLVVLAGPVPAVESDTDDQEAAPGQRDSDGQARPPEPGATAPGEEQSVRPQACVDGTDLGTIRVQLGTVEAGVKVGEEIPIPVRVKGVCGLAAFSFGIALESRIAQLVRVEQTPFLAGKPPVPVQFMGLRPGASRQTIAGLRAAGTGGVDGVGTLARLIFRGMARGATRIDIVRLKLFDADLNEMVTNPVPVRLTVFTDPPTGALKR